jgi:hypothetical protein
MSLFKKPLAEVREVKVGGEVLLLSPPTAFNYREYIRRLKAVYEREGVVNDLESVGESLKGEITPDVIAKLHLMQDQQEDVLLMQIVSCAIVNYPDETWDSMFDDLKLNAHKVLFESTREHIEEFLNLNPKDDEDEAEKKPDTQTVDSRTD